MRLSLRGAQRRSNLLNQNKLFLLIPAILLVINSFGQDQQDYSKLTAVLDSIYTEDQLCQRQYVEIQNKYGRQSEELKSFRAVMKEKYSHNLNIISNILDEYGWLGADKVGDRGNMTFFLVIQHSNLEAQSKYLPVMRDAVKKCNANPANLALLEDRVALRLGGKQIYGTQLAYDEETKESYVEPLEDPDNVDLRRAKIGLEPLQDYLSGVGMKWDPEEYKKKLPAIETKYKQKITK
jgi:hypothetical protein